MSTPTLAMFTPLWDKFWVQLRELMTVAFIVYKEYPIRRLNRTQGASQQMAKRILICAIWMGLGFRLVVTFATLFNTVDAGWIYGYAKEKPIEFLALASVMEKHRKELWFTFIGMQIMRWLNLTDLPLSIDFVLREETAIYPDMTLRILEKQRGIWWKIGEWFVTMTFRLWLLISMDFYLFRKCGIVSEHALDLMTAARVFFLNVPLVLYTRMQQVVVTGLSTAIQGPPAADPAENPVADMMAAPAADTVERIV
jgi:hypothetical protein